MHVSLDKDGQVCAVSHGAFTAKSEGGHWTYADGKRLGAEPSLDACLQEAARNGHLDYAAAAAKVARAGAPAKETKADKAGAPNDASRIPTPKAKKTRRSGSK